jgi:hypothetical protein
MIVFAKLVLETDSYKRAGEALKRGFPDMASATAIALNITPHPSPNILASTSFQQRLRSCTAPQEHSCMLTMDILSVVKVQSI